MPGVEVPILNPAEQLSDLNKGDVITTEQWGDVEVISIVQRNDTHHFSVRGRWADSGQYCEFPFTTLMKHGVESVTVHPDP
jgi:hypothetical protein